MSILRSVVLLSALSISWSAFGDIPYQVTVVDPNNALGAARAGLLANLDAAVADWSKWISSKGQLWIELDVTDNTPTGRFAGGSSGSVFLKSENGFQIFEESGTHKLRTGTAVDPSQADIVISIEPDYMMSNYWIDPEPTTRTTPVPAGKIDLVTVLAHELGHGFGMEGWLDTQTGAPPANNGISVYDNLIQMGSADAPIFTGAMSTQAYGGSVPITFFASLLQDVQLTQDGKVYGAAESSTQNIYHLGRFSPTGSESDLSFFSLMAGAWESPTASSTVGWRIPVNALDAAVIEDLGVPSK